MDLDPTLQLHTSSIPLTEGELSFLFVQILFSKELQIGERLLIRISFPEQVVKKRSELKRINELLIFF